MGTLTFCFLALFAAISPVLGDQHSLYYIYTALSKDLSLPGIYEFTALGMLDDRDIDYYNSKDQVKIPRQDWMKEKMQADYWEKGTQSRKSKEQWFKVNVDILMDRMRHNKTDLHVLQWRHGCEITETNGKVTFLKGIDEYSYDGREFLSFDDENMRWIAPVPAAEPTKKKWDDVPILNQYTKGYLEKECVDWLQRFMQYGQETMSKHSPPDVHVFAKKCKDDPSKLKLTCLATGFYPKDVVMNVRKYTTSLPDHMLESSGIRPNQDDTFQLRKSVKIQQDEKAHYDCQVMHRSLNEPVIAVWDNKCSDCEDEKVVSGVIGGVVGVAITLLVCGGVIIIIVLKKKGIICGTNHEQVNDPKERSTMLPVIPSSQEITSDLAHRPENQQLLDTTEGPKESGSDSDSGRGSAKDSGNSSSDSGGSRDPSPAGSVENV